MSTPIVINHSIYLTLDSDSGLKSCSRTFPLDITIFLSSSSGFYGEAIVDELILNRW